VPNRPSNPTFNIDVESDACAFVGATARDVNQPLTVISQAAGSGSDLRLNPDNGCPIRRDATPAYPIDSLRR